jgi:hypothetical protein
MPPEAKSLRPSVTVVSSAEEGARAEVEDEEGAEAEDEERAEAEDEKTDVSNCFACHHTQIRP